MDLGLAGKRVIVTGASKGIGRAIAEGFLTEGARVAICARDQVVLDATAQELSALGEIHTRRADMADPDDPAIFVDWAAGQLGGLDVVVSNVSAMEATDYGVAFQTDIAGAVSVTRTAFGHMDDDQDANVVFMGSRAASVGAPWLQAYAAMKAATVSMAKSMALEVARRGIRVNVVSPGDVLFPGGSWDRARQENPKLYEAIVKENPFRRLAQPQEIADVVVFIASARASFVTAANVLVDGGATKSIQL